MRRRVPLLPAAFITIASAAFAPRAHAQEEPLRGSWLVRGEDDKGAYEGTLTFERLDAGRYWAHARLASVGPSTVDRSYDAPAVLANGKLTILRPGSSGGIVGAINSLGSDKVVVTTAVLNVRGGAGTNFPVVAKAKKNDKLEVLGREGDWFKVKTTTGATAYVNAPYVKLEAPPQTDWFGTYQGGGAGWTGVWQKAQRTLGPETLARVKEGELSFAAVDLTTDKDALDFASRFRQTFGWKNLVESIPNKRDDAHPDMRLDGGVVLPYGRLREVSEHVSICDLTSSVAIKNVATTREWLPTAGVRLSKDGTRGQLLGGPETCDGEVSFASFLFVSSHGYPSGKVKYTPSFAGEFAWFEGTILDVHDLGLGKRWRNGQTKWLMLAMCNVLREEHWESWAQALRDDKGLRGVLGYFRAAPGPEGTRIINDRFFQAARQGKSILDSWKFANYEVSNKEGVLTWCALVREDAVGDRLDEWTRTGKLPEARPGSRVMYFSTLPAEKQGIPVAKTEGSIASARINWTSGGRPVLPAEVVRGGGLVPGQSYELSVELPRPLATGEKVELTFVNVRETYWEQHGELDVTKMFDFPDPAPILEKRATYPVTQTHLDTLVLDRTKLTLVARQDLLAHVHENEAEIWVKVAVVNASGDVVARGSSIATPLIARKAGVDPHGAP